MGNGDPRSDQRAGERKPPGGRQGTWNPPRKGSKGPEIQQLAKHLGLDKSPEEEVADVASEIDDPTKQPNLDPAKWEPEDTFEWQNDPETFTFDRLVYGDEPLEDQCEVHPGFSIRLRSLTSQQVSEMGAGVGIQQLRSSPTQVRDQNTFRTLAMSLIRVGDKILEAPGAVTKLDDKQKASEYGVDVNEEWLKGRPDVIVSLFGQAYIEFSNRMDRLGRRGKLGNFSGPPSESSGPSGSGSAPTAERSKSDATP